MYIILLLNGHSEYTTLTNIARKLAILLLQWYQLVIHVLRRRFDTDDDQTEYFKILHTMCIFSTFKPFDIFIIIETVFQI